MDRRAEKVTRQRDCPGTRDETPPPEGFDGYHSFEHLAARRIGLLSRQLGLLSQEGVKCRRCGKVVA